MRVELSREAIVEAALAMIDRDGLAALSMRKLGRALGVAGMALYHHFASKDALIDAVVAAAAPEPPAPTGDWRADLATLSYLYRDAVNAHPNLLPVLLSRPSHHEKAAATLEAQYSALQRAGLRGSALLDGHRTWGSYLIGYLVVEQQGRAAGSEWRPVVGSATPVTASLDPFQAARDWDEQFDIGLHLQFDAIEALARPVDLG